MIDSDGKPEQKWIANGAGSDPHTHWMPAMPIKQSLALLMVLGLVSPLCLAGHGREFRSNGRGHDARVNVIVSPRYVRPYTPYRVPHVSTMIGFGVGYGAGWYATRPYDRWDAWSTRPVIIERNTIIERRDSFEDEQVTRPYERSDSTRRLLRDLQGRCFERTYENGVEERVELDAEECDF